MLSLLIKIFSLVLISELQSEFVVEAQFSNGATSASCVSLSEPGFTAQPNNTNPFLLMTSQNSYSPGDDIQVILQSSTISIFSAIIIQARPVSGDNFPVGSFNLPNSAQYQVVTCFDPATQRVSTSGTVTNIDSSNKLLPVVFLWSAPQSPFGDIIFVSTVVLADGVFWQTSSQVVSAVDTEPPMVICPDDVTMQALTGNEGAIVVFEQPVATDNSGNVVLVNDPQWFSGFYFPVQETRVSYTFSDDAGNTATCEFIITVIPVSPCDSNPCQNAGSCFATSLTDFTCVCAACFLGTLCEMPIPDPCVSPTNNCQNDGLCQLYDGSCTQTFCECRPCSIGDLCEIRINPCDFHPCQSGALCVPDENDCTSFSCICTGCFTSPLCDQFYNPCSPNPCQNQGDCVPGRDSCLDYTCQCQGCFEGFNCEIDMEDPCRQSPCGNNGICMRSRDFCIGFTCICLNGMQGPLCQDEFVQLRNPCYDFPCKNDGCCINLSNNNYKCLCRDGYAGVNCESVIGDVTGPCASFPCLNRATCFDSYRSDSSDRVYIPQYTCICPIGFTGTNCAVSTAGDEQLDLCGQSGRECLNQGVCQNTFCSFSLDVGTFCNCPEGYYGENCQFMANDPCSPLPCRNGGRCLSFTKYFICQCSAGFTGTTCEIRSVDNIPPSITNCPQNITVIANREDNIALVEWDLPTVEDDSGFVRLERSTGSPGSYPVGTRQIIYQYEDPGGNVATCMFYVSVLPVDNVDPDVNCIDDVPQTVPLGTGGTIVSWSEPTATDNSGSVSLQQRSHSPGSFFVTGTTTVTYTFGDSSGNTVTCSFRVIVTEVDDEDPRVFCIDDISEIVAFGSSGTTVTWVEPTALDNSGSASLQQRSQAPGDFFPPGATDVTYVFADPSGNTATCIFTVTVTAGDNENPTVNCIDDVTRTIPLGTGTVTVSWTEPTASDNSGSVSLQERSHAPGSTFQAGTTMVTYVFVDPAGNTANCVFRVIVNEDDDEVPAVNCINDVTHTVPSGTGETEVFWSEPTATDNSGSVSLIQRSHAPGSFFAVGSTVVTYTFADSSGNTASCAFRVSVIEIDDNEDPAVNCINDITQTVPSGTDGIVVSWSEPTATDNSGSVSLQERSHAPGSFFVTGSTTVIYTFVDPSGNEASCAFRVTVIERDDDEVPAVNCINDVTQTVPSGTGETEVFWSEPTATDNSGSVSLIQRSHAPGSFFAAGLTIVTYTFVDPSGNTASCAFSVIVIERGCAVNLCPVGQTCYQSSANPEGFSCDCGNLDGNSGIGPNCDVNSVFVTVDQLDSCYGNSCQTGFYQSPNWTSDGSGNYFANDARIFLLYIPGASRIDFEFHGPFGVEALKDNLYVGVGLDFTREQVSEEHVGRFDDGDRYYFDNRSLSVPNVGVPPPFALETDRVWLYFSTDRNVQLSGFRLTWNAFVDLIPPFIIGCPSNIVTTVTANGRLAVVTWTEPMANDECCGRITAPSFRSHGPGSSFAVGTTLVTYVFGDINNNFATCTFTVTLTQ